LPTFDRPKKAISGNPGGGKCPGLEADNRNRERTRTLQCGGFEKKLQVDGDTKPGRSYRCGRIGAYLSCLAE